MLQGNCPLRLNMTPTFQAAVISVEDVSGGCGAMFQISVESEEFKGVPIVKQHRMITETLKDHIKDMHGLRIHTSVPSGT